MLRKIIHIDEERCNGCGACAAACHEGAIAMVGGKARLLRDDYCDGLGDCLPACPTGAISFIEREAAAYDAAAVRQHQSQAGSAPLPCGCPGSLAQQISRQENGAPAAPAASRLSNWPVQIKLAAVNAPYFSGADLLIAADCTAYAYGNFHQRFISGRIALIGCPKLDAVDYTEKLAAIISANDIRSITVTRMEVPCCGGLQRAVEEALRRSGKQLPLDVVTISIRGEIK